jgi:hypothetical protein
LIDLNLDGEKIEHLRKSLIEKKKKRERKHDDEDEVKDPLGKKVKTDAHISALDRLGGEFRDVIRARGSNQLLNLDFK